jgi:hypothetical protein
VARAFHELHTDEESPRRGSEYTPLDDALAAGVA